jgi:hypothetical protein
MLTYTMDVRDNALVVTNTVTRARVSFAQHEPAEGRAYTDHELDLVFQYVHEALGHQPGIWTPYHAALSLAQMLRAARVWGSDIADPGSVPPAPSFRWAALRQAASQNLDVENALDELTLEQPHGVPRPALETIRAWYEQVRAAAWRVNDPGSSPEPFMTLRFAKHKIEQTIAGQYTDWQALRTALRTINDALGIPAQPDMENPNDDAA